MTIREKFEIPKRYRLWSYGTDRSRYYMLSFWLYVTHGASNGEHERARFWGSLLQNSVFFLLVVNAAMFFICATTLAMGWLDNKFQKSSGSNCFMPCLLSVLFACHFISYRFW